MDTRFRILVRDERTRARVGRLLTRRGVVETPVFMPVATAASVKAVPPEVVAGLSARILLANTYHLYLRPGPEVIRRSGGLHRFMNWPRAILTDSGGFQVYSLSRFRKIEENGVRFRSHLDGSEHLLTPEKSLAIQADLNSDIRMVLDVCIPYPSSREETRELTRLTHLWAERSRAYWRKHSQPEVLLFGIVQGGMFADLRQESARTLVSMDFDGYAIGGLSVGEPKELMLEMLEASVEVLPEDRPRYLMGVGKPEDILEAVARGVDMFDCVLPTRNARRGTVFTSRGTFHIRNAIFKEDFRPLDPECTCYTCRHFSRAYLRHLFHSGELLIYFLLTVHNLHFYLRFMEEIRQAIRERRLEEFRKNFYQQKEDTCGR
ncbi:tRNA guanosine(34) transglycosylase Tgt [Thermosulfurimonas sp.]|uniref:tRNA guanosine(34) transglycosylase Tgt n=1 Tax=Thermosulfurimonas sp. TaxID=2080236 RepID=UPI0025DB850C|nr:tRNA guanosine(34) transglycosylase Tgt [Thermosulfurimonas sp.]